MSDNRPIGSSIVLVANTEATITHWTVGIFTWKDFAINGRANPTLL